MAPFYQDTKMDSLFTTRDPAYHNALKKPIAQLFSMTNMRNYEPHADECTAIFLKSMKDLQGKPVDLAIWLQWYAFDVIGNITFQRKFGFMEQRRDVDHMIRGIDEALKYVKVITEDEIERYDQEEKDTGRTDFLAQIRGKQAKDGSISQRDEMNHLSNNLVYQKLVAEIEEADRNGGLSEFVTYEECLKLTYLQAVIKEAMRMHPGVGFPLERFVPPEGAVICGTHLPGGTNICMSAPTVHYDKAIFGADVHEFRPERWLETTPDQLKTMDRAFLAFGYGARTCIGKNISIMEMGKFVPQIFRHFDIEWASPKPEWETHAAWFWKQSEIIVKFVSR
ncbi:related to pisatin demethylase cytochrome P450 [Phialocephala subalpina]|uniref:Related to pisatin demethylase cytochrome P450 n=1 Tax=Phialocephala subalpina TaxID=576137 RepID=A0A1L7XU09_9HELO|nr:related to pisatin demethylase cytochrome P450 [Phialocephala subalpina]